MSEFEPLKIDYVDDELALSMQGRRRYNLVDNGDGTYSLVDVTSYTTVGDNYGSEDINNQNKAINNAHERITNLTKDYSFGLENEETAKALAITNGVNAFARFGITENIADTNDTDGSQTYDATNGHCGTVNGANAIATLTLESKAVYLLICSSYTLSSGAIYGATTRLIATHGLATGTPTNLSLGQTTNAPATITMVANNVVTIKNGTTARGTQYNLIRVL